MHDRCVHDRYVASLHSSGSAVRAHTVRAAETVHSCDFTETGLDAATGRVPQRCLFKIELIDLLDSRPGMRVLEIGTGSGYATALIHAIVGKAGYLESVEYRSATSHAGAVSSPAANLRHVADDGLAYEPEPMGFDRVVVWPPVARVPMRLCEALQPGGLLLCILDRPDMRIAVEIERTGPTFAVRPVKVVVQGSPLAAGRRSEAAVSTAVEGVPELTKPWADGPGGRVVDFWGWLIAGGYPALLRPQSGPELMWLDFGDSELWARLRVAGRELRGTRAGIDRLQTRFGEWCDAGRPFLADNLVPWSVASSPAGESLTPAWASIAYRRAESA